MDRNIALIVRTENNPSTDWESEVKGKMGETTSPIRQLVEYVQFEDFNDLVNQMDKMDLNSMFIMIPILNLSAFQEVAIREIIDQHNNGENEHFITDIVMLLADIDEFRSIT